MFHKIDETRSDNALSHLPHGWQSVGFELHSNKTVKSEWYVFLRDVCLYFSL